MRRLYRRRRFGRASTNGASYAIGLGTLCGMTLLGQMFGPGVDPTPVSSIDRGIPAKPLAAFETNRPMPLCGSGKRRNCVVDGDTFWLEGAKYRIANIDTPELKGKCGAEQVMAKRARQRLAEEMSGRSVKVQVTGTDPYGRKLVIISDASGDIGERLIGDGLAEAWGGPFIDWCRG